ncbi:MAG: cell division protein FtsZ [Bacteroidales bacterium]|nr:cell division protein FtsZ [Bacteroidales bacterium]HOK99486.1 cell division protein FtsZ [Bacteroidales bacterium]HPO66352.1 cell division protein FtsZ [Bacteroidales bacterium]
MKAFEDDLIQFEIQKHQSSIIKVIGVGGGGGNAVNHMFRQGIKDVDFVVCNTDAQALANSPVPVKVQLGSSLTEGRGAGNKPDIGRQAAIENLQDIIDILSHNTKMVFITAGMGGGTGTGAAPVIAKAAKEMGILTVAIVTVPFRFEGQLRINQAIDGINELEKYVDSLLVIHNEKLREIYGNLKISEAFAKADDVLTIAAKGIAEIITVHGYVNVDFADVQTVMSNSGVAILGSARASGENRALEAIQQAINSPLLNNNDIRGAKSILLNITSGEDEVSMDEVGIITDYVTNAVAKDALLIWGTGFDASLGNQISVTIIATGFEANSIPEMYGRNKKVVNYTLNDENETIKPASTQNSFEIKVKENKAPLQKTIEFEFETPIGSEVPGSEFTVKVNPLKSQERLNELKRYQKVKENLTNPSPLDEETIEFLENQPAFMRKNVNLEDLQLPNQSKISRYTLSDDPEKQITLKPENPYLNDAVD